MIAFYLVSLSPFGKANTGSTAPNMPEMPTIAEMPNANSATNVVTAGVNNALKGITNVAGNAAAVVGLGNATKAANTKGVANQTVAAVNKVANTAVNGITNAAKGLTAGITNAVSGVANTITGNKPANKPAGNVGLGGLLGGNVGNKGSKVPGLNFPLSQV